jgi:hypothetical protein
VLNGRNGPGGCASWQGRYWENGDYRALADLLRALRSSSDINSPRPRQGFNILYAPYTAKRSERDGEKEDFLATLGAELRGTEDTLWSTALKEAPQLFQRHKVREHLQPDNVCSDKAESDLFLQPAVLLGETERRFEKMIIPTVLDKWIMPLRKRPDVRTSARSQFLYAAVQFRQSRHISALMSEAVYPCPHRFNDAGIDNDEFREREVARWLTDLSMEAQILFRKPGGHA